MSELGIVNCHVHTFTQRHIPRWYPHPALRPFRSVPLLVQALAGGARLIGQLPLAETLDRLYRFNEEADNWRQADILDGLVPFYPDRTRFVVLPMDMAYCGHGPVAADVRQQHDELAALCADPRFAGRVIPFASVDPRRPDAAAEVERCLDMGFRGLKIYPRLGYPPDHPALMEAIYPMLVARGLPVTTHCSRGGIAGRGLTRNVADRFTEPAACVPVLEAFPELRLCLAHFGGQADWRAYAEAGIDPRDPEAGKRNWLVAIRGMIESGAYPNLWTDISYTLFHFENFIPFLRLFLRHEALAQKVLFGSDYYMTRQEELSERAVCFRLRNALGEDLFRQIAETNPRIWLGEAAPPRDA